MSTLPRAGGPTSASFARIYNNTESTAYLRPIGAVWYTFIHWDEDAFRPQVHVANSCPRCAGFEPLLFVGYVPALLHIDQSRNPNGGAFRWEPVTWFISQAMVDSPAFRSGFDDVFTCVRTGLDAIPFKVFPVGPTDTSKRRMAEESAKRFQPFDARLRMARVWKVHPSVLETAAWSHGDPLPLPSEITNPPLHSAAPSADVLPFPRPLTAPSAPFRTLKGGGQ